MQLKLLNILIIELLCICVINAAEDTLVPSKGNRSRSSSCNSLIIHSDEEDYPGITAEFAQVTTRTPENNFGVLEVDGLRFSPGEARASSGVASPEVPEEERKKKVLLAQLSATISTMPPDRQQAFLEEMVQQAERSRDGNVTRAASNEVVGNAEAQSPVVAAVARAASTLPEGEEPDLFANIASDLRGLKDGVVSVASNFVNFFGFGQSPIRPFRRPPLSNSEVEKLKKE